MELKFTTRILQVEANLGFSFPRGLSQTSWADLNEQPVFSELRKGIDRIKIAYQKYTIPEIRESQDVRQAAFTLFQRLGPRLWPDCNETQGPSTACLSRPLDINGSKKNQHWQEYPRILRFSDLFDRGL